MTSRTTPPPDQDVHPDAVYRGAEWTWCDPAHGEHFRRCSWCSSIHPEDLAVEPVWQPHWADQKYGWPHKFYVNIPNRDPAGLFVLGSTYSASPLGTTTDWVAWADLTPEQAAVVERDGYQYDDGYQPSYIYFGPRAVHFGKFYTIHLSDPAVPADVKHTIEQRSGMVFDFTGGRVTWRRPTPADPPGGTP